MFEYVKDYQGTVGDDKVYIKDITVTGTSRDDALDNARRLQALVRAGGSEQ